MSQNILPEQRQMDKGGGPVWGVCGWIIQRHVRGAVKRSGPA